MVVLGLLFFYGSCFVLRRSCFSLYLRVINLSWFVISLKIDFLINIWDKLGKKGEKILVFVNIYVNVEGFVLFILYKEIIC